MHKMENGETKIVGLTSFSNHHILEEDCHGRMQLVTCNGRAYYTRVGWYADWIESIVGDDHC